jgi:putative ABC transport system ATP-binding protein
VFYKGKVSASDVERAASLLAELGLADRLDQYPNTLSFGQQQRVAIARAVMNDPELILADEPTGTLDSAMAKQVVAILKRLNEEGKTVILVTHDPEVAAAAERRYLLKDGRLKEER